MRNLLLFTKIPPSKFPSSGGALGLEFVAYEKFQIWVRGGITDTIFQIYFSTEMISLLKITLTVSRFQRTIIHTLTLKIVSYIQ
jgi:hypothetical protein